MGFEAIKAHLAKKGLKATHQRLVVLQCLLMLKNHPSVEQVYEKIRPGNPTISLGTIYKTLETFVEAGIVQRVSTKEGAMKYDANLSRHDHIYSTNTQEIIDFEDEELSKIVENYINKKRIGNFKVNDIRIQIEGEKINPEKDIDII